MNLSMPKLFQINKKNNSLDKFLKKSKKSAFQDLFERKIFDEKRGFYNLELNIYDWHSFAEFIFKLEKNLKKTDSIVLILLHSALVVEGVIDYILIKIYDLDKYEKFSAFEFLSKIDARKKILILRQFKKLYKRKRPIKKEYKDHFNFSVKAYVELRKRFGVKFFSQLEKINEEINKKDGFKKPNNFGSVVVNKKIIHDDYLPDDVTKFIKGVNLKELEKINDLRNIISHEWKPEQRVSRYLKVPQKNLTLHVKNLCIDTINNLIGLKFKK